MIDMNNTVPKILLDALNANKNSIYVWVRVTKEARRSIRVDYAEAVEWVFAVAREHEGVVPYYIGGNDVFIGSVVGS